MNKNGESGFFGLWRRMTTVQKLGAVGVVLVIVSFALVQYGLYQRTQIGGRATEFPITPTVGFKYMDVTSYSLSTSPGKIYVGFFIDSNGQGVDGAQLVAYIPADKGDLVISDPPSLLPGSDISNFFSVVANRVEYESDKSRYKIVYGLISNQPDRPYFRGKNGNSRILIGTLVFTPNFAKLGNTTKLPLTFNRRKTKVVSNVTGENLATFLPNYDIYLTSASPSPSPTPIVSPTPTVQPTPTVSPPPSPGEQISQPSVKIFLEGYRFTVDYDPVVRIAIIDADTNQVVPYTPVRFGPVYGVSYNHVLNFKLALNAHKNLKLFVMPEKRLAQVFTISVDPNTDPVFDFSRNKFKIGDLTGDGTIDLNDYHKLVLAFDPLKDGLQWAWEDLNTDGVVDIDDYAFIAANFDPDFVAPSPLFP